jgi:hypothetical protein
LVGLVAVTGGVFTGLSFALARRGQLIDRFTKAVDQLGDPAADVRLGGIYALERLAWDSHTYAGPVLQVLAAYVSGHGKADRASAATPVGLEQVVRDIAARFAPPPERDASGDEYEAPVDVKAAVAVLARRDTTRETEPPGFDFEHTNLRGVRADGIHWQNAALSGVQLEDARLRGAQLQGAILVGANLQRVQFGDADLTGASLVNAQLDGARLGKAIGLESATWTGAKFTHLSTQFPNGFDAEERGAVAISVQTTSH